MMSHATEETHGFAVGAHVFLVGNLLEEAFGQTFELWNWEDRWTRFERPFLTGETQSALSDAPEVAEILRKLEEPAALPQCCPSERGGYWLAVPIRPHGRLGAAAVARIPEGPPDLLARFAQTAVENQQRAEELLHIRQENESFAEQVTQDFEELTFLRSISGHLQVSNATADILDMATDILPMLDHSIQAEAIGIIGAEKADHGWVPARGIRWEGEPPFENDRQCHKLLDLLSSECRNKPLVLNQLQSSALHKNYPRLRNLILVTLSRGNRVLGWLIALNRQLSTSCSVDVGWGLGRHEFGTSEATLMDSAASMMTTHALNVELFREKEKLLIAVVRALVSSVEAKDDYTRGHSERVALFAKRLGQQIGFSEETCERLYLTGLVHDVGKIGVSDATLKKPGRLTDEEFKEIKRHPDDGWAILSGLEQLSYVLPGVLYHHERFDGRGYPDGLVGEEIPLDGRILAVADAYDAMTSDRPYRPGMPQEKAEAILCDGAGTQWDPTLIAAFMAAMPDVVRIREGYHAAGKPRRKGRTLDTENDYA